MTRKQFWTATAGAATTVLLWTVQQAFGVTIPVEIAGTIVIAAGNAAGYWIRENAPPRFKR